MATDVSSFRDAYKKAIVANFPDTASVVLGDSRMDFRKVTIPLRYGTNMHQPFAAYAPVDGNLSIGNLEMLKGGKDGLSLTNLQDMSQALNVLKYFDRPAVVPLKHLNPCGFKVQTNLESTAQLYLDARSCDERSHFGAVVGLNTIVDAETAEHIMSSFVECVIAPAYTDSALEVLNRTAGTKKLNNAIRVARYSNLGKLPKFIGDNTKGIWNIRTLADGTLTFEVPYLTRIRTPEDFVLEPMIPNEDPAKNNGQPYIATVDARPYLADADVAWKLCINTRSNAINIVKDGKCLVIGTGQQERIGALEHAIWKGKQKKHDLRGSVVASDGFLPSDDFIDAAADEGIRAAVWPAGSLADGKVIDKANKRGIAMIATLERCFLHI